MTQKQADKVCIGIVLGYALENMLPSDSSLWLTHCLRQHCPWRRVLLHGQQAPYRQDSTLDQVESI